MDLQIAKRSLNFGGPNGEIEKECILLDSLTTRKAPTSTSSTPSEGPNKIRWTESRDIIISKEFQWLRLKQKEWVLVDKWKEKEIVEEVGSYPRG
uniref:Uncharacterized protein n=1 Tax=Vitis vinifera TaxID=29760 RepID=F6HT81_VITVI